MTAREKALEKRVAELERMVAYLQARPVYVPYWVIQREGMTHPVYTPRPASPNTPWMPSIVTC